MDAGTVLLAAGDAPSLAWFTRQAADAGRSLAPLAGEPVEAACFETSFDALQAIERLLVSAPAAGFQISLALVAFGWGDAADPGDAQGAVTVARDLLAATPPGSASTCGSAAMVAGPLLGSAVDLIWTEDIVQGPEGGEPVFRIVPNLGAAMGFAPCIEWARRHASSQHGSDDGGQPVSAAVQAPGAGLPRLSVARADTAVMVEARIARLALQAHARGDVVLRVSSRPPRGATPAAGKVILLELMAKHPSRQLPAGRVPAGVRRAPGFACLDEIEEWMRAAVRRAPLTLVLPDPAVLDDISRVVVERLLQDTSLADFSVITSQAGDGDSEALRQLMSTAGRTGSVRGLVSR